MRAKKCVLTTTESWARIRPLQNAFKSSAQWLRLMSGSVVVDSMFYVPLFVCVGSMFGLWFGMHYCVSFLVLQSS